jgi:hypothetical protein
MDALTHHITWTTDGADIKRRLHAEIENGTNTINMMVQQCMAAGNMGISCEKLAEWEEIIRLEKFKVEQLEKLLSA